jgi:hypothetical protein
VEAFLAAAVALRDAQFAGKGDLAASTRQEREAFDRLIRIGGEPVRQTLLAAAVDEAAARELLEARLERELEPRGFDTLLAHVRPTALARAKPKPKPEPRPKPKQPDDRALREKLRAANESVAAAEAAEQEAVQRLAHARKELERARTAAEEAQRRLDRA